MLALVTQSYLLTPHYWLRICLFSQSYHSKTSLTATYLPRLDLLELSITTTTTTTHLNTTKTSTSTNTNTTNHHQPPSTTTITDYCATQKVCNCYYQHTTSSKRVAHHNHLSSLSLLPLYLSLLTHYYIIVSTVSIAISKTKKRRILTSLRLLPIHYVPPHQITSLHFTSPNDRT